MLPSMALATIFTQLLALASIVHSTTTENQFGLIGASNAMLFLNGFHFISGHPDQVLHANHHCVIMSADFIQCAIYVPGTNPARLAGIEYIISGTAFEKLDYEERQLWHSHMYEVSSGLLVEPGLPANVDLEAMRILAQTYGKTVHTWPYLSKNLSLPLGIPELVNGYTANGQLSEEYIESRDKFFGLNHTEAKEQRVNLTIPDVIDGADSWKKGFVLTLELKNTTGFAGPGVEGQKVMPKV